MIYLDKFLLLIFAHFPSFYYVGRVYLFTNIIKLNLIYFFGFLMSGLWMIVFLLFCCEGV